MKKLLCILLCLCLLSGLGGALAASAEASEEPSGEASAEAASKASGEPSEEPGEQTELDLSLNGIRVADVGVDVSSDGRGQYQFSLAGFLRLLGLEMSYDEQGNLEIQDKLGILKTFLD